MKTLALTLASNLQGENNKILTLLTPNGITKAIVYRATKHNNPLRGLCDILTYSSLELTASKGDMYILKSGEIIENFYDLRLDYDKLNTACDIIKIVRKVVLTGYEENLEVMQLALNTLYVIDKLDNTNQIKAIFQIILLSLLGFAPNELENDLPDSIKNLIRHIKTCDKNKLYSIFLNDKYEKEFCTLACTYMGDCID